MHRLLSDRARGWRRALCGVALGLLAWSAHGVPANAPQDLRIDGEVLPGKSVDLLEQALSRVKFNTDPQQLRRGLVENRLLARAVEDQLTAQSRADLDASVEIEAGNLLEQVYGRRYREDLGPYLRQPRALSAERLREVLAPRSRGLVENSLLLDETQRREAAGVELIGWQFPGQPAQVLDLLSLYEGDNVQGQVELQQGNLAYLARQVQTRIRRDYLWYRLARDGFGPAERQGVRTLVRDKLVRHRYLHQIGLYSDFHHESDALRELAGKVSDKDAEAYYRRNLERYRNVAQVQAAHIRLADQASADKVYAELRNGLAFDEAVRRYSLADDRDRDPPGDLGLIRPQDGRLDLLRKTALIQKADTVSQPMRIDGAFEIVRVRSREDRQLPLDDRSVRFEVNQAVAREQLAAQFQAVARAYEAKPPAAELDREQAIQFMQMLRDEGDPRSPPLGGLQPRQGATAQELADPKQYQAFEERQTRELVQAYTSGVQQIPEIRARIEAAEQGGERSAEEIDEARAALGQLEMMRDKLQRESPQLLPGDSAPTSPAAP